MDSSGNAFLLLASSPIALVKLDGENGVMVFRAELDQDPVVVGAMTLDVSGNVLLSARGQTEEHLHAFDGRTGEPVWDPIRLPDALWFRELSATAESVLVYGATALQRSMTATTALVLRFTNELSVLGDRLPSARCGTPYASRLEFANVPSALDVALVGGQLPRGLALDAATGEIQGIPEEAGLFRPRFRVAGDRGAPAERALDLLVEPGELVVVAEPALVCPGGTTTLRVEGNPTSVRWLPSGETTQTLTVSVQNPAVFGVETMGADGCERRGSVSIGVIPDHTPPAVAAPPSIVLDSTTCVAGIAGLTLQTSPQLRTFLDSGLANDACTNPPLRLLLQAGGATVTDAFLFTPGASTVTFRFGDVAGNVGTATSVVTVLRKGDLNLDGRVDILDVAVLAGALVGNVTPGQPPFAARASVGDTNGNGALDVVDLVLEMAYISGNVTCLPVS